MSRTEAEKKERQMLQLQRLEEYRKGVPEVFQYCNQSVAASILGCSPAAVSKQCKRGVFRRYKDGSIELASLESYITGESKAERLKELKQQRRERSRIELGIDDTRMFWDYNCFAKMLEGRKDVAIQSYLMEISQLVENITHDKNMGFIYKTYESERIVVHCFKAVPEGENVYAVFMARQYFGKGSNIRKSFKRYSARRKCGRRKQRKQWM